MDIAIFKTRLQTLIGSSLKINTVIPDLEPILQWELPIAEYKTIIKSLIDMYDSKKPITVTSLTTHCGSAGDMAPMEGWEKTIKECVKMVTHTSRIVGIVDDIVLSLVRDIMAIHGAGITQAANDPHSDVDKLTDTLESVVMDIRNKRSSSDGDDTESAVDSIRKAVNDYRSGNKKPFLPSGLRQLDWLIKGFGNSELVTIAARPSVGKSALATGLALDMAVRGISVGFISLEMDRDSILKRMAQQACGIDLDHLISEDKLEKEDEDLFFKTLDEIKALKIKLVCPRNMTAANIKNTCRRIHHSDKVEIIFIDYLQKMQANNKVREQQVAICCETNRLMAKELDIPIIQLAQLNRGAEGDQPSLAHLRESGSIENDSHKVILIDRSRSNDEIQDCNLIVAKNRSGRVGPAKISFMGGACRFVSRKITTTM
jgi:replicative DNA helicase